LENKKPLCLKRGFTNYFLLQHSFCSDLLSQEEFFDVAQENNNRDNTINNTFFML